MADTNRSGLGRVIAGLVLFGIAFGYIEAAVVVYLRTIYQPIRHPDAPLDVSGDLFPLITMEQLEAAGPHHLHRLKTELGREFATLVLLAGAASLAARNFNEWVATFAIAFGVWDIFYYVFLKLLIGWPASLLTWDILFLLPVPWVGPVIAPALVAAAMVGTGLLVLWRERTGRPVAFAWWHWAIIFAGGFVIVASFARDFRNVSSGGYPRPFQWWIYAAGLLAGLGAFGGAFRRRTATTDVPDRPKDDHRP
ncbi:MAG TPA: hypothetical protein PL151_16345 [Phycisphaerae bacterium]|nr:hypothetical protein [Phycisphaerae bacterium]HOJ72826.1 hypothetical protein [Phycisphaerae bacterium]HOM51747.1 hypothetical protein [Phycisphaerae bacterium]HON64997.1 hypothetical protein [Phycisphaerae bacterium]HOQ87671.1 hypothetical protein [Phycisphaerae bacterium]